MKKIIMIVSIFLIAGTLSGWTFSRKKSAQEKPGAPAVSGAEQSAAEEGMADQQSKVHEPYVGLSAVMLDKSCQPDKCLEQCKISCEAIVGEECWSSVDVLQECTAAHPPQGAIADAAAMHQEMTACLENHAEEYKKYRCLYFTSELDHRLFENADPDEACRKTFSDYQGCLQENKFQEGAPRAELSFETLKRCQDHYREELDSNQCVLYTSKNIRRLYGRNTVDHVTCFVHCK